MCMLGVQESPVMRLYYTLNAPAVWAAEKLLSSGIVQNTLYTGVFVYAVMLSTQGFLVGFMCGYLYGLRPLREPQRPTDPRA